MLVRDLRRGGGCCCCKVDEDEEEVGLKEAVEEAVAVDEEEMDGGREGERF